MVVRIVDATVTMHKSVYALQRISVLSNSIILWASIVSCHHLIRFDHQKHVKDYHSVDNSQLS